MEVFFLQFPQKKFAGFPKPPYFCGVILHYYTVFLKHFTKLLQQNHQGNSGKARS